MLLRFGIKPCKVVLTPIGKDCLTHSLLRTKYNGKVKYAAFSRKYNTWYEAKLQDTKMALKAKKPKENENCVFIHWVGYATKLDEWVLPEHFKVRIFLVIFSYPQKCVFSAL